MTKSRNSNPVTVLENTPSVWTSHRVTLSIFILTAGVGTALLALPPMRFIGISVYLPELAAFLLVPLMFSLPMLAGILAPIIVMHDIRKGANTSLVVSSSPNSHIVGMYVRLALRRLSLIFAFLGGLLIPIWFEMVYYHSPSCFSFASCANHFTGLIAAAASFSTIGLALLAISGVLLAVLVAVAVSLRFRRKVVAIAVNLSVLTVLIVGTTLIIHYLTHTPQSTFILLKLFMNNPSYFVTASMFVLIAGVMFAISIVVYALLSRMLRRDPAI